METTILKLKRKYYCVACANKHRLGNGRGFREITWRAPSTTEQSVKCCLCKIKGIYDPEYDTVTK